MTNSPNDRSMVWHELFNNSLISHHNFVKRSLFQMRLNYRYTLDDIISQIFIDFQQKIEAGKIKAEFDDEDNSIFFVSLDRNAEWRRILSLRAYLRVTILNYLLQLYAQEKKELILVKPDTLEHLDLLNRADDEFSKFCDDEGILRVKEKLKLLSLEDHKILDLFFFQQLGYEEIAQCLKSSGFPPDGNRPYNLNSLRKKKQRALEKLRRLYIND